METKFDRFFDPRYSIFSRSRAGLFTPGERIDIDATPTMGGLQTAVYVGQITHDSFTLLTAKGHVEAGAIRFSVHPAANGNLIAKVESEARNANTAADTIYNPPQVPGGKDLQTLIWMDFLFHVAIRAGYSPGGICPIEALGVPVPGSLRFSVRKASTPTYQIAPSRSMLRALGLPKV